MITQERLTECVARFYKVKYARQQMASAWVLATHYYYVGDSANHALWADRVQRADVAVRADARADAIR